MPSPAIGAADPTFPPADTDAVALPSRGEASRREVLTLAALSAMATLSTNVMLPSLPRISEDLALSVGQANALLGVFFAVFAVAQLFVGPWSDRVGRHRLVLGGLAVFGAGTVLCATATGLPMMLAGRAIQALGVAAASVLARAAARDRYDGAALTRLLGLIMVVMAAAPGFSPLLGGIVHALFGWRAVFVVLGVITVLTAVAWSRVFGETLPPSRRLSRRVPQLIVDYARLLADRRFIAPAGAVSLVMGALFAFFAASPPTLMNRYGLGPLSVGGIFAGTVFIVFGAGTLAPRLASRHGPVTVLRLGIGLAILGAGLLTALSILGKPSVFAYVAAVCVFLFGMGMTSPVGTALTMMPFASVAGQASALLGFLQMAAAASTITLTAALLGAIVPLLPGAVDDVQALAIVMLASTGLAIASGFAARPPARAAA